MPLPIPEFIEVGPYTIPIQCDQAEMKRERREYGNTGIQGVYRSSPQVILLDPDTDISQQRALLLHEIRHAIWAYASMDLDTENPDNNPLFSQEEVIRRETPALLDTLRRNPELVEFLMDRAF